MDKQEEYQITLSSEELTAVNNALQKEIKELQEARDILRKWGVSTGSINKSIITYTNALKSTVVKKSDTQ